MIRTVTPLVALGLVWSAPLGAHHIQAGAYGAERRFPLRPPVGYLIASGIAWLIVVGLAAIAVRSSSTIGGIAAGLGALTLAVGSAPRWHRLARRWLVLVPTGLVVHDPVGAVRDPHAQAQRGGRTGARLRRLPR